MLSRIEIYQLILKEFKAEDCRWEYVLEEFLIPSMRHTNAEVR